MGRKVGPRQKAAGRKNIHKASVTNIGRKKPRIPKGK